MPHDREFNTPMMKQYLEVKAMYPDTILFFRLGDFYEMFLEDAQIGSRVLGITLTARHKGQDGKVPMAGIPYHAAEGYINRLVKAGYKVAICEQTSPVEKGTEIVQRSVVRVVTPSTNLSDVGLDDSSHRFLMTFNHSGSRLGVALIGLGTGEVWVSEVGMEKEQLDLANLLNKLNEFVVRYQPAEILLEPEWFAKPSIVDNFHRLKVSPFVYQSTKMAYSEAVELIKDQYQVETLEGFGIKNFKNATLALAVGLSYLVTTQKTQVNFLKNPRIVQAQDYMYLSSATIRNLELFNSIRLGITDYSLYSVINQTQTPMGARKLKTWLARPLVDKKEINERLDVVSEFVNTPNMIQAIQNELTGIGDTERSISRLAIKVGNARDLNGILQGLSQTVKIADLLKANLHNPLVLGIIERIDWALVSEVIDYLRLTIADDPPLTLTNGGMIRAGYSPQLDNLREIASGGKRYLQELESRERSVTGVSSLKVAYNRVFGYYIEISKSNLDKVPEHYIRRQTLVNAERFIIPELKDHEDRVLTAESEANQLEYEIFQQTIDKLLTQVHVLHEVSELISMVDVLVGLSKVAYERNYVRPKFEENSVLEIIEGRHPVVELMMPGSFVPNSLKMDVDSDGQRGEHPRFIILTGANMAGKSTYIRQIALMVILAQIGSFVPAQSMRLGIIDQIHTRIGAMDDLAAGLSTFMVEMTETANILNNLSDRSLVILDEVGRGTSTYDGLSIAWATSEYLIRGSTAKTLFATHYLELTKLAELYVEVGNYHLAVSEQNGDIDFLYRVKPGNTSRSYGIEVAKRAGLPKVVVKRAEEILGQLDIKDRDSMSIGRKQLNLF